VKENLAYHDLTFQLRSLEECDDFARKLATLLETPFCIALEGTLGAGKTQLTRFLALALGADSASISSPTFVLLQSYATNPPMIHVDAYRIADEDEFLEIGIEEYLESDCITIIEWADRFPEILPRDHLRIRLELSDLDSSRMATLRASGNRSTLVLKSLEQKLQSNKS
jgi:tRNA threonylcarbamoyladenosine biosynthesis protein TsaE